MWGHFCTIFLQKLERETTKHAHQNLRPRGRPSALAKKRYSASRLSNIQIKKDRMHKGNSLGRHALLRGLDMILVQ